MNLQSHSSVGCPEFKKTKPGTGLKLWIGLAVAVLGISGVAHATVDEDFEFATGLINFEPSFADYAQKVVDAILVADPSQRERTKIIQAEILIKHRKYADAETLVREMGMDNPRAQAISLSLGRNYFAVGETDKARELYDEFFKLYEGKTPTDKDVVLRYRDAAYQYAQMKEMIGDYEGAAASYKRVEDVTSGEMKRSIQLARAQALVQAAEKKSGDDKEKLLKEALELCELLQWGGLDLQFVDSIVIMANVELARGNSEAARKVLMSHMDIIKPIDDTLKELGLPMRESPMAGARSLLGRLWKEEADRLAGEAGKEAEAISAYSKALGEYYNVFVKYGDSPWGPTAGMVAKEIKDILETKYDKIVKIDLGKIDPNTIAGTEFKMADNLFRQKKHAEASVEYLKVLAQFPEAGELSIGALGNLAQCYMHQGDDLFAKMVALYLGERFAAKSDIPARAIVSLGKLYEEGGNADMGLYMYNKYLKYCPTDSRAGQILFYLASKAEQASKNEQVSKEEQAKSQAQADAFYAKIITDYPEDQNYTKALSRRAWRAYLDKDYAGAVEGMKLYIEESKGQPSPTLAQAMFALGDSYRQTGDLANAVRQFNTLVNAISPDGNPYGRSAEDLQRNRVLLEQARFYLAFSLSRLPSDATRKAAIGKLDEFLQFHEKSMLAPKALNLKGSLQLALKDPAANATFAQLAQDYPDTDEGKNAQYARINGALELGQFEQAREALGAMLANPGSYSVGEFARVGQAMLEKEQWAEAAQAFTQVNGKTDDRALLERALYGIGAARYELDDYAGAVEALDEMMQRWPNSSLFYPAKFTLARANIQLMNLSAAKVAINDIFKYARDPEVVNDTSLLYADVLKAEGDQVGALAAYKRLEYFGGGKSEKARKQIETAILDGLALASEMGRYAEVIESADRYLELYPTSPKVSEIRQKRTSATLQLAAEVAAPPPAATPAQ
ncbi:MAG: tetratricopeptide repeat protein [Kiritimatiellia bacterium]|jgi:tetratricopeptide (TPR) repeat protein|nr:tetratricopeptide repeat protein [Kiritimatiellia bacterium]